MSYGKGLKSDIEIAKELSKLHKSIDKPKEKPISNLICGCGRKIEKDNTYFIMIEPGEQPIIMCEMCVSINP